MRTLLVLVPFVKMKIRIFIEPTRPVNFFYFVHLGQAHALMP
jgi:hypothetical protein